jgi:hypothetical protein
MKPSNNYYKSYSNYSGLVVIYLVSVLVALTTIIPGEEHWYLGMFKASIWPLYVMTKVL